jgi:hypothetical protein
MTEQPETTETAPGQNVPLSDGLDEQAQNYKLYRGKCKEFCEEAIANDPTLTLVRGHYFCPFWGQDEPHWWTVRSNGEIYDPTRLQFPSKGNGIYTPFDGICECANCGKEVLEEDAKFDGNYAFCSYRCNGEFVGVF